ncbi:cysteine desulfurase-like protein [Anthocerotibacter panamensis]|uniref:cysteine desulfurase-like protein n=1 Tax=Anthocerotibacter panamensis TaxID=2857077 RepID=UPI001C408194|nr:cysteine desulfurase-like protein [Anthocerotibacter panamensis]
MRNIPAATPVLDLEFVRQQFPALAGPWTFFDNAGGSQILGRVVERIREFLLTSNVQVGASYAVSALATQRLEAARQAMAAFIHAAHPEEVVLGSSTTQLLGNLALAMGPTLPPHSEIIVTNCDHEANIGAWVRLREHGVTVKFWEVDPETLELRLEDLDSLMTARTRLVCFTHASNVLGTINPVAAITRFVHERGAQVCVDGVAYAPHRAIDVQAWDVDYYVFSFYKVYGPHQALLYGKRDHLLHLANLNHFFIGEQTVPYKLQPGNINFELTYGLAGILEYFTELASILDSGAPLTPHHGVVRAYDAMARHEELLAHALLDYLSHKPKVRVLGYPQADGARRLPTISFVVEQRDSARVPGYIDQFQIGIRYGDFYARRLIEALGLVAQNGVIRVSMVHYNTLAEVYRLLEHLDAVL